MVIDEILVDGFTVDSVDNTMVDEINVNDETFHFATATDSDGLGVAECENSVDEPIRSLTISGNTGSSTSNLLDFTTPKISTNSDMTVTRNNNEFTFSGTLQTWRVYLDFQQLFLEDGKSYIVSCNKYWTYGSVGVRAQMEIRAKPNSGATSSVHQGWGGSIKFTVDNSKYTYWIRVQAGPTAGEFNETLRWWLNEGDTALEYEPFEPVAAVPTKLTVESENYFKVKPFTQTDRGVKMVWDGEFLTLNGTVESDGIVQWFIQLVDRTETATGSVRLTSEYISGTFSNSTAFWVGFYTEDNVNTQSIAVSLANGYRVSKFSLTGNLVGNLFATVKTGYTYNNAKWRIRIEEHEPQTVTIPSDIINGYSQFKSIGGYGDSIKVDTLNNKVVYIREWEERTFTGAEGWYVSNGKFVIVNNTPTANGNIFGYCNKYPWHRYADVNGTFGCNANNITCKDSSFGDAAAFIAWLQNEYNNGTPMIAVYALSTPIETDITDTELGRKLLALNAYDKYTRVRVDSNVSMPINVNYWKQITGE